MPRTMRQGLTAATGMDALTHAIEGYVTKGSWVMSDTPHGVADAILLPMVMRYNAEATGEKYRDIAKAIGVEGTEISIQQYIIITSLFLDDPRGRNFCRGGRCNKTMLDVHLCLGNHTVYHSYKG